MTRPGHEPTGPGPAGKTWGKAFGADLLARLYESSLEPGYAAATRRQSLDGPAPRWQRGLGRSATAAVLLVFGVLLAVTYQHAVATRPGAERARTKLVHEVKSQRSQTDRLQRRDERLRSEVARQRDQALSSDSAGAAAADRLRSLESATGLVKVAGPGMVVVVTDAPDPQDPVTGKKSSQNLGRVLDLDLQRVVNELWRDGAEAVAVDNQRLGATSTIRTAGEAILVDFRPVTSPYRVTAVGPASMGRRFSASRTAAEFHGFSDRYDMGFSVRSVGRLQLPAAPNPQVRYARPADGSSPSPGSSSGSRSGGGR